MSTYPSAAAKWQAVRNRDPLASTAFVYCVKTTHIYCRPNCSARLARRSNVEFYDHSLAAQKAGYRACKRCRPELPLWEPAVDAVSSACATISAEVSKGNKPSLDALAKSSGLTKWHFHRVFKKSTGFTPKDWAERARRDAETSKTRRSYSTPKEDDGLIFDDIEEDCDMWDKSVPFGQKGLISKDLSTNQATQDTFCIENFINDFDFLYDSGPSTNTGSIATPTSLDGLSTASVFDLYFENSTDPMAVCYPTPKARNTSSLVP